MLTLASRVHDDLGNHVEEKILAEADGEAEAGPVMPILQNLEGIAVEVDISVEVHLVEGLYGNLAFATVLELVGLVFESEVVLDRSAGISGLLILSGTDGRDSQPERSEDWGEQKQAEKYSRLEATPDPPRKP